MSSTTDITDISENGGHLREAYTCVSKYAVNCVMKIYDDILMGVS